VALTGPAPPLDLTRKSPCTPEAVPEPYSNLTRAHPGSGTSSRCNLLSDADPEVSPSLDAPATICHPFGVEKTRNADFFLNRNHPGS
jgi:hypothetical protein